MIRILLADDHDAVRRALRRLLSSDDECSICGEAVDGEEAVALCRRLAPEVVILDARMPRLSGFDAARQIRKLHPTVAILILTMYDGTEARQQAMEAGAHAFMCKRDADAQLIAAVRSLASRRLYMAETAKVRSDYSEQHSEPARL